MVGQIKNNSADTWNNMTSYDPDWPNWQVNTYYGTGVDAPSHAEAAKNNTNSYHGLLLHRQNQIFILQWHTVYQRAA